MSDEIKKNLANVRRRITRALNAAGRSGETVKLVAVTKTHQAAAIRKAIAANAVLLGENKVQEAESKIAEIGRDAAEWHLIGHLQSNKARKAVKLFDVIHSLDSAELAHKLDRICGEEGRESLSVLAQVDIAGESTKSGIAEPELPMLVEVLKRCEHLRFDGLMVLPPYDDDVENIRPYFKRLREIRDRLAAEGVFANGFGELSMGMSHDMETAIEEGATIVRVGTAIFGSRK